MKKNVNKLLPDLVKSVLTNNNNSFELSLISIIRSLVNENDNKTAEILSELLKKHQSGMFNNYGLMKSAYSKYDDEKINENLIKIDSDFKMESLVLNADILRKIDDIVLSYNNKDKLLKYHLTYAKKIILNGHPGTGKSTLAIALANKLQLDIYSINIPSLFSSYLGDSGKSIENLFNSIKNKEAVFIFDEFDSIATTRSSKNDIGEMRRIVNSLLNNLDQWNGSGLIIATTNDWSSLDPAVSRRFDEKIDLNLPDFRSRKLLWLLYTQNVINIEEADILSEITDGMSPAYIELYSKKALRMKILREKEVFLEIINNLNFSSLTTNNKQKIINYIHNKYPEYTTRMIANSISSSKSTVQRYIEKGESDG
ncbi:ATP-binding protein [Macrococcoides caseolyticum subsp. hominis]|uniref:AAA family ATPase n=1 Tax=Macrococcoides caseolyticum TaxID=69966 RepID=UPI000C14A4F3|nr:ATP-binding protein [Macrococcus caseolyticus]RAI81595.1 ATP-binding protein [Macrococcus caseolyticus subsp. hominis]